MEQKVTGLILESIKEINLMQPIESQISVSEETEFIGKNSRLDSLGFVNLIVDLEQRINSEFSAELMIMDERAMSQKNSPFKSVTTLSQYIITLLLENGHE